MMFVLPLYAVRSSATITNKTELKEYFSPGLKKYPNIHFVPVEYFFSVYDTINKSAYEHKSNANIRETILQLDGSSLIANILYWYIKNFIRREIARNNYSFDTLTWTLAAERRINRNLTVDRW